MWRRTGKGGRTKAANAPYVPSRVVRDGALMSGPLPSARIEGGEELRKDADEGWIIDKHVTRLSGSPHRSQDKFYLKMRNL